MILHRFSVNRDLRMKTFGIDDFDRLPDAMKQEAFRRLNIIKEFERYAAGYQNKRHESIFRDFSLNRQIKFPDEKTLKWRTFRRWRERYRKEGILSLVDRRGGAKNHANWPEQAKAALFQLYCNINAPSASW